MIKKQNYFWHSKFHFWNIISPQLFSAIWLLEYFWDSICWWFWKICLFDFECFHFLLICSLKVCINSDFYYLYPFQWVPSIRKVVRNIPIILVGCQSDMRFTSDGHIKTIGGRMVMSHEGNAVAKRINAVAYMECSAKTQVIWYLDLYLIRIKDELFAWVCHAPCIWIVISSISLPAIKSRGL